MQHGWRSVRARRRTRELAWAAVLAVVALVPTQAVAQSGVGGWPRFSAPVFGTAAAQAGQPAAAAAPPEARAPATPCPGCPRRRPWIAVAQVLGVNVVYNLANQLIKPADEKIYFQTNPKTWWDNITYGFEWDDNTFQVNQFGHPYQGNNYFTAGRANGLSFWESAPLAALGSLTWEYLGERHRPSLNDLVMTTMGGISLGEMLHRTAWLVRDPTLTGKARLVRELVATAIDPITGANRFISGDASRLAEKPREYIPSDLYAAFETGVLWRGDETPVSEAAGSPFVQVNLGYGTLAEGRSAKPFDAFVVDLRLGGGAGISEGRVRGRLYGRPLSASFETQQGSGRHFMTLLTYDYHDNPAFQFGGQGVSTALTDVRRLSAGWHLVSSVSGGVLVLGAMDSLYRAGPDRQYDFGPGFDFGAGATIARHGIPLLRVSYGGVWLHTVDGAQADHLAQSVRADLVVPIRGRLAVGTSAEYSPSEVVLRLCRRSGPEIPASQGVPVMDEIARSPAGGRRTGASCLLALSVIAATIAPAKAQQPAAAARGQLTLGLGAAYAATKADCDNCAELSGRSAGEDSATYQNAATFTVAPGWRVSRTLVAGAELTLDTRHKESRSYRVLGTVTFWPSTGSGFFLRAGYGLVGVTASLAIGGTNAASRKYRGMGVAYGAGWELRRHARLSFAPYGMHYVSTLGSVEVGATRAVNVISNAWLAGVMVFVK